MNDLYDQFNYQDFGKNFLQEFLSRGYGNYGKRDTDVLVFHLLNKGGVFQDKSQYEVARLLRTTPAKIRSLVYDKALRFPDNQVVTDAEQIRKKLGDYFKSPLIRFDKKGEKIYLQIDDPVLLDDLRGLAKRKNQLIDGSFSTDVATLSPDAFISILEEILPEEEKKELIKKAEALSKEKNPLSFKEVMQSIFTKARDKGIEEAGGIMWKEFLSPLLLKGAGVAIKLLPLVL